MLLSPARNETTVLAGWLRENVGSSVLSANIGPYLDRVTVFKSNGIAARIGFSFAVDYLDNRIRARLIRRNGIPVESATATLTSPEAFAEWLEENTGAL